MAMKKVVVWAVIGLTALAGAYFAFVAAGSGPAGDGENASESKGRLVRSRQQSAERQSPAEAVRKAMDGMAQEPKARKRRPLRRPADMFANLGGRDRKLAEAVMDALDRDDFDATVAAADDALKSKNPEVRLHAVEALEWFGLDALPELTGAMADPDEEVAEAAEYAWELALSEVDDASRRFAISAAAMATLDGKDHLETICGHLTGAALELIDGEDDEAKASELRISVVQALVDIMDGGLNQNVEQAKEAYEDITGNEWISIDEAELYLSNPDGYEPPEERASSGFHGSYHGGGDEVGSPDRTFDGEEGDEHEGDEPDSGDEFEDGDMVLDPDFPVEETEEDPSDIPGDSSAGAGQPGEGGEMP